MANFNPITRALAATLVKAVSKPRELPSRPAPHTDDARRSQAGGRRFLGRLSRRTQVWCGTVYHGRFRRTKSGRDLCIPRGTPFGHRTHRQLPRTGRSGQPVSAVVV